MANYTDRLLLVVDAATKAAQAQLGQLQGSLSKTDAAAETTTGKTGVLAKGFDLVKNSGLLAGIGVATVAQQVADAVGDWTRYAKTVSDAGSALGITTEQASEWIAVGEDTGVSADQMVAALLRVERAAAGPAKPLTDLGIAVKKARDGSTDLTGTAVAIAEKLSTIRDPAERAAAGVAIFGKGWKDVAPVFANTGEQLQGLLDGISDAERVTDDEARTAEKMRAANVRLGDAVDALKTGIGQAAAEMAPFIEGLAQVIELVGKLSVEKDGFSWSIFEGGLTSLTKVFKDLTGGEKDHNDAAKGTATALEDIAEAGDEAAVATDRVADAYATLKGELDFDRQALDVADAFDKIAGAAKESWDAAASGATNAGEKARDYQRSIITAKDEALKFIQAIGNVPPSKTTEILTLIDQGNYQAAQRALDELGKPVYSTVVIAGVTLQKNVKYIPGVGYVPASAAATGAAVTRQGTLGAPVAAPAAAMPTVAAPVVVNVQGGVIGDPSAVAQAVTSALTRYQRLNGPRSVQLTKGGAG